jgi:hypothetical protein
MTASKTVCCVAMLLVALHTSGAQTGPTAPGKRTEVIDLATHLGSYRFVRGSPAIDEIVVVNIAPGNRYSISFETSAIALPPLEQPAGGKADPGREMMTTTVVGPCKEEKTLLQTLLSAKSERSVAATLGRIRSSVQAAVAREAIPSPDSAQKKAIAECNAATVSAVLKEAEAMTSRTFAVPKISDTEDLEIAISREDAEWEVVYAGKTVREWRTFYAFVASLNNIGATSYDYFSTPDGDSFRIGRRRGSDYGLVAALQYIFEDFGWYGIRPTAGIGVDLTKPSVFAGLTMTYRQNLAFTAGGILFQSRTLDPRYEVGQIITSSLDSQQLTRDAFLLRPFVSVGFRFGSSPFSILNGGTTKPE